MEHFRDWDWVQAHRFEQRPRLLCQVLRERLVHEPNRVVVSDAESAMTIDEFTHRVSGLAERLMDQPVDRPIVVLVDHTARAAEALIGVWWGGRCFVAVNVDDPPARIIDIARRVGAELIIDGTGRAGTVVDDIPVINVTTVAPTWIEPVPVAADLPALIVFTSGSTGRPKGVVRTGWQEDFIVASTVHTDGDRGLTATHSPLQWLGGFGAVRTSLSVGALHLVKTANRTPNDIVGEWTRHGVECVRMTPSLMDALAHGVTNGLRAEDIREVKLAGESTRWDTVGLARQMVGSHLRVHSWYGGSEGLGPLADLHIGPDDELGRGIVPLGHVTGDHIRLQPCTGEDDSLREIVVHRWVSRGYWDDEDLQHSRFGVDANGDPFWRSGDVVDVDAQGRLCFRGRIDDMVKISGKLVEPAEAVRVLESCPGVRRSFVMPRLLPSGRHQLVAHVEIEPMATVDEVRRILVEKLPSHLIPGVIVPHAALPLTERGKVDRKALMMHTVVPWRAQRATPADSAFEAAVLAEVAAFLAVDELGMDDDVWQFGMDSLGAIELSEVLARRWNRALSVRDFIGTSTPRMFARILDAGAKHSDDDGVTFNAGGTQSPWFVLTGGGGLAVSFRDLADAFGKDRPVVVFEQHGLVTGRRPDRSVRSAARRHIAAMRRRQPQGPYVLIGHSWGGIVVQEMAVILRESGEAVSPVLLDARSPLDNRRDHRRSLLVRHDEPLIRAFARRMYWWLYPSVDLLAFRLGADRRNQQFFRRGIRLARRHRPRVFGGPMLVIDARESTSPTPASSTWTAEFGMEQASVPGGHTSMIKTPYVRAVADEVRAFLARNHRVSGRSDGI